MGRVYDALNSMGWSGQQTALQNEYSLGE